MTILLIEDGTPFPAALLSTLRSLGMAHETVASAGSAQTYLYAKSLPDVLLLDRRKPSSECDALFADLTSNPLFKRLPLILVQPTAAELKSKAGDLSATAEATASFDHLLRSIERVLFKP
ncbi:MAG TPA: hypothetical protein VFV50_18310 [Bdellovibrionales bacterium]|nr:hypothetical protein [Bdellovibrionales bacterium]